ncbi:hypothetical protein RRG08_032131 [Elysia crispata]|uniref:Uncharacterized protein n=1 Tax=Elysia crispata TaxID=231223 RepID=A0AAE0ZEU3_9GAST|nr:hypothetical protein RRG08_032131 [Elysia crispata]
MYVPSGSETPFLSYIGMDCTQSSHCSRGRPHTALTGVLHAALAVMIIVPCYRGHPPLAPEEPLESSEKKLAARDEIDVDSMITREHLVRSRSSSPGEPFGSYRKASMLEISRARHSHTWNKKMDDEALVHTDELFKRSTRSKSTRRGLEAHFPLCLCKLVSQDKCVISQDSGATRCVKVRMPRSVKEPAAWQCHLVFRHGLMCQCRYVMVCPDMSRKQCQPLNQGSDVSRPDDPPLYIHVNSRGALISARLCRDSRSRLAIREQQAASSATFESDARNVSHAANPMKQRSLTPAGTVSQGPGPGRNRVQGQARSGRHDPPGQGRRKPRRSPRAGAANERAAFKSERDKPRPPLILVEGGRGQRHVIIDPVMFSQRELRAWRLEHLCSELRPWVGWAQSESSQRGNGWTLRWPAQYLQNAL